MWKQVSNLKRAYISKCWLINKTDYQVTKCPLVQLLINECLACQALVPGW